MDRDILLAYQKAINRIDDYFEYDIASIANNMPVPLDHIREKTPERTYDQARSQVYEILDDLTKTLAKLNKST